MIIKKHDNCHQDNIPLFASTVILRKLLALWYDMLPCPAYCSDLFLGEFFFVTTSETNHTLKQ